MLFDKVVINEKNTLSIHIPISKIYTIKNLNEHSILKNKDEKLKPKPSKLLKIFIDNWEDLLLNTLQKQILL